MKLYDSNPSFVIQENTQHDSFEMHQSHQRRTLGISGEEQILHKHATNNNTLSHLTQWASTMTLGLIQYSTLRTQSHLIILETTMHLINIIDQSLTQLISAIPNLKKSINKSIRKEQSPIRRAVQRPILRLITEKFCASQKRYKCNMSPKTPPLKKKFL